MAAEQVTVTVHSTDAELNALAAKWAYQAGLPAWLLNRILFAERRIAILEASKKTE